MTQQHPITPPPELIYEWAEDRELLRDPLPLPEYIANCAAQWGADQELEACCEWIGAIDGKYGPRLRLARRPKPATLKEQALAALERYEAEEWCEEMTFDSSVIRRALERLND
jgi:hypothetical protein